MARRLAAIALAAALTLAAAQSAAAAPLDALVAHDLKFAGAQLNRTLAEVPSGSYPHYTNPDGTWFTRGPGWWISGFFPGSLWLMYQATGNPAWRSAAAARQAGIESQKTRTDTHDLGFMLLDSFGNGWKLTGDDSYRQTLLTAAASLDTRYSPIVKATRSWNNTSADAPTDFKVIVDNLMNLELLHWAAKHGGSSAYTTHAIDHAYTSMREHLRTDGSTYHLVVFDSNTGAVKRKGTVQGYSDTSTWSRGQAWAIYGFAMAYRYTGDKNFRNAAERAADYWIDHRTPDWIPYWDFQAPGIPNEPRDTSAAAIAASAMLELATYETSPGGGWKYRNAAEQTLRSLSSPPYLAEGTTSRSILLHGTSNKPAGEYDTGLIYGDYFFLEALQRYRELRTASGPVPDYNGDGYDDAAAGTPSEDGKAGAVNVLYGSSGGLTGTGAQNLAQAAAGGVNEANDRFGAALATGDFNGDGYADLASGAPGEDSGGGVVNVMNGSAAGLTSTGAKQLSQANAGLAKESGDGFGTALTAGDFNGDAYADLAAGAPGEDIDGAQDIGYVTVFYGSASGLGGSYRTFSQNTAGGSVAQGERFGEALAAGMFNDDVRGDLAVGSPGEASDAGAVTTLNGTASGLTSTGAKQLSQSFASGQTEPGDHFGAALAVGRFDGDLRSDLAVGAPQEGTTYGSRTGTINVMFGSDKGIVGTGSKQLVASTQPYGEVGSALAAGDVNCDGHSDLVWGSPHQSSDAGSVTVRDGIGNGGVIFGEGDLVTQDNAAGSAEPGDLFGSAVTVGDYNADSCADLFAGAPGEDTAAGQDVGVAGAIYSDVTGLTGTGSKQFDQTAAGGQAESGDRFASAVR